ncbi:MAG TPA: transcription factor S [archaeon]|nr:transcription factor S [archaeon]
MKFCDHCGGMLIPKDGDFVCRNCGKRYREGGMETKITTKATKEKIEVIEDNTPDLPVMDKDCKKCKNKKAYYWLIQTRSADEPPTQFFRCTECGHTWREYK